MAKRALNYEETCCILSVNLSQFMVKPTVFYGKNLLQFMLKFTAN